MADTIENKSKSTDLPDDIFADSVKALYILNEDVDCCRSALEKDSSSQFWRRTLVRSQFAYIEATVNTTQIVVSSLNEIFTDLKNMSCELPSDCILLSPHEIALLQEKRYRINSKGDIEEQRYYENANTRLLYALNTFSKLVGHESPLNTGDNRWKLFTKATKLRDRITHPRGAEQLEISSRELEGFEDGLKWYKDHIIPIQETCKTLLPKVTSKMTEFRHRIKNKIIPFVNLSTKK